MPNDQRAILALRSSIAARAMQVKQQADNIRLSMANPDGTCKKHVGYLYDECECDKRVNIFNGESFNVAS